MINEYRVSVLEDEESSGDGWGWWLQNNVNILHATGTAHLKMTKRVNFMLCMLYQNKQKKCESIFGTSGTGRYNVFAVSQIFSKSPPGEPGRWANHSVHHKLHSFLHSVDTECLLCVKNYNYKDKLHTMCKGYASRRLHSQSCQPLQGPHLCSLQFLPTESPGIHPESGDMHLTQISFILGHWT